MPIGKMVSLFILSPGNPEIWQNSPTCGQDDLVLAHNSTLAWNQGLQIDLRQSKSKTFISYLGAWIWTFWTIKDFWATVFRTLFEPIYQVHFPVRKKYVKTLLWFSLWTFLISYFQSMAEEALEAVSKNRKSHLNIDNVSQTGSQSSLALSEASQGKSIK